MKSADFVKALRGKTAEQLKEELVALHKEQFSLRMQKATGQLTQATRLGQVKRNIARVKTVLQQQAKSP